MITYDPRGNGKSDRPDEQTAYDGNLIVEDVIAVLDETNTKTAVLVGLSFSTKIVAAVAARYPDRVDAIVSIGTSTQIVDDYPDTFQHYTAQLDEHDGWAKFNRDYWQQDYEDFTRFFMSQVHSEPHSTKQLEDSVGWASEGNADMLTNSLDGRGDSFVIDESVYEAVRCPVLIVHGAQDRILPVECSERVAELTGGELHIWPEAGHAPQGRYPARFNTLMRDFLARHLGTHKPQRRNTANGTKRVLYLSSPIGLGHARRDLAITRELRKLQPDLQVDWLAQDPVTRFLDANNERIHAASRLLANESAHIEAESGEHDLHAFQAVRSMDEILIKNFMVFQEVLEEEPLRSGDRRRGLGRRSLLARTPRTQEGPDCLVHRLCRLASL